VVIAQRILRISEQVPRVPVNPHPVLPLDPGPKTPPTETVIPNKPPDIAQPRPVGTLVLHVTPWAYVFIGARKYEASPDLTLTLPEGTYRLRMENPPLHWSDKRIIQIKQGKEVSVQTAIPLE
jgi:hypothetical protein